MKATCFALLILLIGLPSDATPSLSVEADRVIASGLAAHGEAILLSVSRQRIPWMHRIVHRTDLLTDSDGDGEISLRLDDPVADQSLWILVDLTTGGWIAATPNGGAPRHVDSVLAADTSRAAGRSEVSADRQQLHLMVVRPGIGAWQARLSDGGASDFDGASDGRLQATLGDLAPIGASPAAVSRFQPGDLLVGIDSTLLEYSVVRITPSETGR